MYQPMADREIKAWFLVLLLSFALVGAVWNAFTHYFHEQETRSCLCQCGNKLIELQRQLDNSNWELRKCQENSKPKPILPHKPMVIDLTGNAPVISHPLPIFAPPSTDSILDLEQRAYEIRKRIRQLEDNQKKD